MDANTMTFGYARVSSKDQHADRQLIALADFGVARHNIFCDKASGSSFNRPEYRRMLRTIRPGSLLVITSIDRLGRNYNEILEEWRRITKEKQVSVVVLDMPLLDTRETKNSITGVFLSDLVLQLLSYVAQVERENIRQRQTEGIAAAKARGVRFGRPRIEKPADLSQVITAFEEGLITRKDAAKKLGICPCTFDSWRNEKKPPIAVDFHSAGYSVPSRMVNIFKVCFRIVLHLGNLDFSAFSTA